MTCVKCGHDRTEHTGNCCYGGGGCRCNVFDERRPEQYKPRWPHPRDAAAEAVVYALIEDVAKERKEEARLWVANHLREESLKGVEAVANGNVIGSVTRSKDTEKLDVNDREAFAQYVAQHHPQWLQVDYRFKEQLLRQLKEVDGIWIDRGGNVVPGVGKRVSKGSVRVLKDDAAKDVVRRLLSRGAVQLDGLRELEASWDSA